MLSSYKETEAIWIGLNLVLFCFKVILDNKVKKILIKKIFNLLKRI